MNVRAQFSRLDATAREALANRIRSQLAGEGICAASYDVVVVGGGAAALTLALEVRTARPDTRILDRKSVV